MSSNEVNPVVAAERLEILDVLRGLAVGGILIGNMQWFSGYGMAPATLAGQGPLIDQVTLFLVHFFIEGKFYSIFSFLFGVGFALQIARAEERSDTRATLFKRRLFWLLVIGVLHAFFLWAGDILSVYALMGFLLLLFRQKSDEGLLKWAVALMAVPVVTYALLYIAFISFAPPDTAAKVQAAQANAWTENIAMVGKGSYWEILSDYNLTYLLGRWAGLIIQMRLPKILAMFLLGYYAYRQGFFQDVGEHRLFIRKVLIYGVLLGLAGNALMAALAGNEAPFPPSAGGLAGVVGYAFGVPALALSIVALAATLWQKSAWRPVLGVLAPVGRMALTNYLTQTVICVLLFYGYGLGLFGTIGATAATLIAIGIFVLQIALSTVWLRFFTYGPMEWIWRQLTYGKRLPLRRLA